MSPSKYNHPDYPIGYAEGAKACELRQSTNPHPAGTPKAAGWDDGFFDTWSRRQVALSKVDIWRDSKPTTPTPV